MAQLRKALAGLDDVLAAIEGLADYSADTLTRLVEQFADDKQTQMRVAVIVSDVSRAWATMANNMSDAITSTRH